MKRRSNNYANLRSSKKTKNLLDFEENYLKAVSIASQILSLGAGMVGIPVPFLFVKSNKILNNIKLYQGYSYVGIKDNSVNIYCSIKS
jgi:hypothetical protein